jgi:hypothetical protein
MSHKLKLDIGSGMRGKIIGGGRLIFLKAPQFFHGFIVTKQKDGFTFSWIAMALKRMTKIPGDGGGENE